jgi:hypothetical protein
MYVYHFMKLTSHVIKFYLGFSFTIQNVDNADTKQTPYGDVHDKQKILNLKKT